MWAPPNKVLATLLDFLSIVLTQRICNIPQLWDFLISPDFHRGGRFRRQIPSLCSTCFVLSYLHVNIVPFFSEGIFMLDCGAQSGTFYRKIPQFLLGGIGKSHITKTNIKSTEPSLHHPTHSGFAITLHCNIRHGPKSWCHGSL